MSIQEFMDRNNIKSHKKVLNWLNKGLISGAYMNKKGNWVIHELARPPYTRARAKTADSIYISIVEGCNRKKGVCAKLYNISDDEFNVYISNLKKAGLITVKRRKGVEFYFATTKSQAYIDDKKGLKKYLKEIGMIALKSAI